MELISECGLEGAKRVTTHLEQNQKLTSQEYDQKFDISRDKELEYIGVYQRLIGRPLYLVTTRPDISFAIQHINQFMHAPKESHYEAALRAVRYIEDKPELIINE